MELYQIKFEDGSEYTGEMVLIQPNGMGKYSLANGDYYDGMFFNGLPNGKGFYLYKNLCKFYGMFKDGLMHGEGILFDNIGKQVLKGKWIDGFFEGKVKLSNPNELILQQELKAKAASYEGFYELYRKRTRKLYQTANLKRVKQSTPTEVAYSNGVYYGPTKDGKRHGDGMYAFSDRSVWFAHFENGSANGLGRYVFADGSYYFGNYTNSKKNGIFEYYDAETNEKKTFRFLNDEKEKQLEQSDFTTIKECIINFKNGDHFKGIIKDDKYPCYGDYFYANGDHYTGEMKNFKKHGRGTYVWVDGRKYEGEWFSDAKHGFGTFVNSNGESKIGTWFDNFYSDHFPKPTIVKLEDLSLSEE